MASHRIAVIGTGIMGSGIAANFLKAGYPVVVWNRTPAKTANLQRQGASLADSPKAAAAAADVVFEVTANDESSQAVWQGQDGILAGAAADTVLIASATLTVDWTLRLSRLAAERGFSFFDMPMTGGRVAAESGKLTLLVGGDEQQLDRLKPALSAISAKLFYFGPAGSGMKYKLILNGLQAAHLLAFGEAMRLAQAAGLPADKVGSALCDRPGGIITEIAWSAYQRTDIPLTFSIDWITKDLTYAKQLASDLPMPVLDDVLAAYRQAQADGRGGQDWAAINSGR